MAGLIRQQKLAVEVDFYGFALQDLDDTQVPLEYPEGREAGGAFLTAHEGRLDIESAGHTHTAAMTAEVWDGEPPTADDRGDWEEQAEAQLHSPSGELALWGVAAGNHNRYVTVHAYHPRGVNRALRAGVRCVEHGNLLDDDTIRLLLEHDAYLVPTLVTYDQMARFGKHAGMPEQSYRKIAEVHEAGLTALERAHRAGVNLVFGSDLLGPLQSAQLEEFTLRAQVQPPADILRAATTTAARLLRMEGEIGTLAVGACADLLVVDGNPLDDIRVLTRPEQHLRHVIKAGTVI
ncbi:amidohydrolase family protein [Streptomyces sp. NPDC059340]|uniref:amidohydrolase family protein n=1 Tax=Streptomyces sp. NPDC059340 TaxID=3346806 RepID=UPI0036B958CD